MSDPPSYDQHLLNRLNALKASGIQLDSSTAQPPLKQSSREATPESDLSVRLRSLRNGSLSPSPGPKTPRPTPTSTSAALSPSVTDGPDPLRNPLDSDDKTLEELLAEIGPEDQWTLNPDDPRDIQKLLDEAKTALPRRDETPQSPSRRTKDAATEERSKGDQNLLTRDLDMSAFALDDEDKGQNRNQNLEDETREVQGVIAKFMDEVEFERKNEPEKNEEAPKIQEEDTGDERYLSELSLPSPPAKLPDFGAELEDKAIEDFASDIATRMAALRASDDLGLPSAPTFKPTSPAPDERMKKYANEEIETWCVICQDDATVECLGCDGDLYCAKCWKEGHIGPDVGWEERRHKWLKYKKPN